MTRESYENLRAWFVSRPAALKALVFCNKWLPRIFYCAYPLLIAALFIGNDPRIIKVIAVPAAAFLIVSALRKLFGFERPYDVMDIEPLMPREKSGASFVFFRNFWSEAPRWTKTLLTLLYVLWLLTLSGVTLSALRYSAAGVAGGLLFLLFSVEPLIPERKGGDSFPSRHAASAAVIAASFLYISLPLGILASLFAVLICAARPLAGVHFKRDVIAGAALSAVISIIGFCLI